MAEMKRGATATITKRCHGNVPVPVTRLRYRCKGEVCGCVQKMVGRSRIPGVPRVGDKETSDNLDTVQTRASQTSQAFVHGRRLEVIPSKRAFSERFESSREVVVHGDGRGTRDLGNGSRTCPERNLSHPRYSGVVEVVVQLLSWEVVVHGVGSGTRVSGRR